MRKFKKAIDDDTNWRKFRPRHAVLMGDINRRSLTEKLKTNVQFESKDKLSSNNTNEPN